jgi:branched-chain amino acid transport system substrate-binding protein
MPKFCKMLCRAVASLAIMGLLASNAAKSADEAYDLHAILPLTGGGAFLGKAEQRAMEVAENVMNAHGGMHGRPVHVIFHDDQTSPQLAVQLTNQVMATHPAVILGSTISSLCNAMAPLVQAAGPVMYCLSPSVRTKPDGYVFSASIDSHDQQRALMTYFHAKGWNRIALITTTDASGQDAEKNITSLVQEPEFKGVTLIANEHFAPSDVTVAAQIATMKAGRPQALISWATAAAGATVFRDLKQAGLDLPTAASGSNMTKQQMVDYASFLPTQVLFGVSEWAADGDPRLNAPREVVAQQKLFFASMDGIGVYPDTGSELGWEPLRTVVAALNKVPAGADAKTLHDFMLNWTGYVGADGVFDFKKTPQRGLNIDNAVVVRWDATNKKWHLISKLRGAPLE